jgi:cell division septation protein DedD
MALARSAIGEVNLDYYLPILTRFEKSGKAGASWNWSAGLYTLNWMAYRGLWKPAQLYLGTLFVAVGLLATTRLVLPLTDEVQLGLAALGLLLSALVPGFLGNAWLYADIQRRVVSAVAASGTLAEAHSLLAKQASTRAGFVRLLKINAGLAAVGAALFWYFGFAKMDAGNETPPSSPAKTASQPASTAASEPSLPIAPLLPSSAPSMSTSPIAAASADAAITAPLPPASTVVAASVVPQAAASAPVIEAPALPTPLQETAPNQKPVTSPRKPDKQTQVMPAKPVQKSERVQPRPQTSTKLDGSDRAMASRYYVNVGLFAKESNAQAAHARLVDSGLKAVTQELTTPQGKRMRVRAGPFATLAQAQEATVKIQLLNLEAKIVTSQ